MNYIGLSTCDTANGPGVRVSLFCSGCTLHCPGCFNEESWDFGAGRPFTDETLATLLKALEEDFVEGLSLLGGDPLEPENRDEVLRIVRAVRERFGNTKTIWALDGPPPREGGGLPRARVRRRARRRSLRRKAQGA